MTFTYIHVGNAVLITHSVASSMVSGQLAIGRFIASEVASSCDRSCWFRRRHTCRKPYEIVRTACRETEAYVQRECFIHVTRGRTAAATGMEHRAPSKRIRSREIAADDKFQFKRRRSRFKALQRAALRPGTEATLSSHKRRTRNGMWTAS